MLLPVSLVILNFTTNCSRRYLISKNSNGQVRSSYYNGSYGTPYYSKRKEKGLRPAILSEAKKHIGTPYRFGGDQPGGFDCSGFTSYVLGKNGISIPRKASDQYAKMMPVKKPQPGDLVFFNTSRRGVSHVGIYLGRLKMIHAPSEGKAVEISAINNKYFGPKYVGARRITEDQS